MGVEALCDRVKDLCGKWWKRLCLLRTYVESGGSDYMYFKRLYVLLPRLWPHDARSPGLRSNQLTKLFARVH